MAIQFLRGTTNAINASTQTLKSGQPLLNMDTGCLYLNSTDGGTVNGAHSFQYPSLKSSIYTIETNSEIKYGEPPGPGSGPAYYLEVNLGMSTIPKGTLFVKYSGDTSQFNQITELHLIHAFRAPGTTYYTYINLQDIVLPENASVGWFEIDLPEDVNTTPWQNYGVTGVFKGYRATLPLGYDGSNVVVDNTSYACIDINNNFLAKQTFKEGIETGVIKSPSGRISMTATGEAKLNSFEVRGQHGNFSVTSTAEWKDYGTYESGGAASLDKLVLNKYYAFPTINDYRVLATERPVNSIALPIPQGGWVEAAAVVCYNTWTASSQFSSIPSQFFQKTDSRLKVTLDLGETSIVKSTSSGTAYLKFYEDFASSNAPTVTLDQVRQTTSGDTFTATYRGCVPAYWIAPALNNKKLVTTAIITVYISPSDNSARFYIQTTSLYQPYQPQT